MAEYLTSSLSYSVLPPLLTSTIQSTLYSHNILTPRHPQSPQFHRDRKIVYTSLVAVYFVYTVYAALSSIEPTLYDLLGVSVDCTSVELRSRFKQLYLHERKANEIQTSSSRQIVRVVCVSTVEKCVSSTEYPSQKSGIRYVRSVYSQMGSANSP
jgi:hypothetical protein